jgi:hypothetical protein
MIQLSLSTIIIIFLIAIIIGMIIGAAMTRPNIH